MLTLTFVKQGDGYRALSRDGCVAEGRTLGALMVELKPVLSAYFGLPQSKRVICPICLERTICLERKKEDGKV